MLIKQKMKLKKIFKVFKKLGKILKINLAGSNVKVISL